MDGITNVLTSQQCQFLQDNFVVYDPIYQECYNDYSRLENAQVILVGDNHHLLSLQASQCQFLQSVVPEQACMVGEGFPPGQSLNVVDLPGWQNVPKNLTMRGADVRLRWNSAQYLEWRSLQYQQMQRISTCWQDVSTLFRNLAGILNNHFLSNNSCVDKKEKMVFIPSDLLSKIEQIIDQYRKTVEQYNQEIDQNRISGERLKEDNEENRTFLESNIGLLKEIIEASKEYRKVVAIWGRRHFTHDDDFIKGLEESKLSYVILLHNRQKEIEAEEIVHFGRGKTPTVALKLCTKTVTIRKISEEEQEECVSRTTYTIGCPAFTKTFFHPALQSILHEEIKKEPLILTAKKCNEFASQATTLSFPAKQKIHIEDIPLHDFHKLSKFHGKMLAKSSQEFIECKHLLFSIFNNIFMINSCNVQEIEFLGENFGCFDESFSNKPTLVLSSVESFRLTLNSKGQIRGYASYLFRQMQKQGIEDFSLEPNQCLIFYDLSCETRDLILESPDRILPWLGSKIPPQTKLSWRGQISVCPTDGLGIALMTKTGLTFKLE